MLPAFSGTVWTSIPSESPWAPLLRSLGALYWTCCIQSARSCYWPGQHDWLPTLCELQLFCIIALLELFFPWKLFLFSFRRLYTYMIAFQIKKLKCALRGSLSVLECHVPQMLASLSIWWFLYSPLNAISGLWVLPVLWFVSSVRAEGVCKGRSLLCVSLCSWIQFHPPVGQCLITVISHVLSVFLVLRD